MHRPLAALLLASCGLAAHATVTPGIAQAPPTPAQAPPEGLRLGRDQQKLPLVRPILQKGPDEVVQCMDYYEQPTVPMEPLRGEIAVIALHGADASRFAYTSIGPQLQRLGAHVFAIDLRSGASQGSADNLTAFYHHKARGRVAERHEDYADITFAIQRAREMSPKARIVLMGTGYSAALALAFAALERDAGLAGVLAFSPSEGVEGWECAEIAGSIAVPVALFHGTAEADARAVEPFRAAIGAKWLRHWGPLLEGSCPAGLEVFAGGDEAQIERRWKPVTKLLSQWRTPPEEKAEKPAETTPRDTGSEKRAGD